MTTHAVIVDGDVVHLMCRGREPIDLEAKRAIPFDLRSFSRMFAYVTCDACYGRVANRARRFGVRPPEEEGC